MTTPKKFVEKRNVPRILYSGHIFFSTKSGLYEGELKNYSKNVTTTLIPSQKHQSNFLPQASF